MMLKLKLFILLLIGTFGFSQTKALYEKSVEAYKSKDYVQFLKLAKQLDSIRPAHPTFTYNLASAYTLNGKKEEALLVLKRMVLANNTVAFEDDSDFESIKNDNGFKELLQLKVSQSKTIKNSVEKLRLSEKDLHPEGLFYLEKQKLWLSSSIRNKKIVSFDSSGKCSDWFTDCLYSVFALKADHDQKYLWVVCSAIPEMNGFAKELDGKSEILKIEISSKKLIKRYTIEGNHVFGDIAVAKNNDVFISDSAEPIIYKIENDNLILWKDLRNKAFNLQGITFNKNESKLFIADYLKGICVVDIKSKKEHWLEFPNEVSKKGIDGLVYYKNSLIAIENGVVPIRIMRYKLNDSETKIIDFTILDNNREEFNEPALAALVHDKLYFFANSPWKFYDKNFQLDEGKFENPKLFELDLEKPLSKF
ncbi:tetratricopeptide repeat protein [Flavobacterium sp. UBA7680]|uniref:tetratricopeptide repeat protein n=1 Tax=Flavobacterium sp. UBA7680 TaxID=1946559 RepID=UPI0025C42645|nr:tetratricopeptide repeat protein [Flavobacterium sp. UBA7680]